MSEDAYIYDADIYCESCGEAICRRLDFEGLAPDDPDDETTYDSSEYPKGPYPDAGGEADSLQHCACCHMFLGNPLTTEGVRYTLELINEFIGTAHGNTRCLDLWAEELDTTYSLDLDQQAIIDAYWQKRNSL